MLLNQIVFWLEHEAPSSIRQTNEASKIIIDVDSYFVKQIFNNIKDTNDTINIFLLGIAKEYQLKSYRFFKDKLYIGIFDNDFLYINRHIMLDNELYTTIKKMEQKLILIPDELDKNYKEKLVKYIRINSYLQKCLML